MGMWLGEGRRETPLESCHKICSSRASSAFENQNRSEGNGMNKDRDCEIPEGLCVVVSKS